MLNFDATRIATINGKQTTVADTLNELFLAEKGIIADCNFGQGGCP
jgi:hypothetical protein